MSRSTVIWCCILALVLVVFAMILWSSPATKSTNIQGQATAPSSNTATLSPNDFTANLLLPSGWITSQSVVISFSAFSSHLDVNAGSLSNDGINWGPWISIVPGQVMSTTWHFDKDGIAEPVYLRIKDSRGQIATVISGTVNVDAAPPVSFMSQLSPFSSRTFSISWSATDATSDVVSYDVQVRVEDTGIWTDWLNGSTATSGLYDGTPGETYYFRVRARDLAGNIESWRTFDAVTNIPPTD